MAYPYPEDIKAHREFWGQEAEMKSWSVYLPSKTGREVHITTVHAKTEKEAQDEAWRQLTKPGRTAIGYNWRDMGCHVTPK